MCTFITVGVAPARVAALENTLRAAGFEVEAQSNPGMPRCFSPGLRLLLVTRGGCSCDLGGGAAPRRGPRHRVDWRERFTHALAAGGKVELLEVLVRKSPLTEPPPSDARAVQFP
jgi:hypothetical protein